MRSESIQMWGTVGFTLAGIALAAVLTAAQPQAPAPAQKKADAKASADQSSTAGEGAKYTATTENVVGSKNAIRIDLVRFSTDAERAELPTAWTQALAREAAIAAGKGPASGGRAGRGGAGGAGGADADNVNPAPASTGPTRSLTPAGSLSAALEKAPTLGYVWSSSEIAGYTVRYAVQLPGPAGSERIILVTDRRLGDSNQLWNPVASAAGPKAATANSSAGVAANGSPDAADKYEFSIIELRLNAKGVGEGKVSLNDKVAVDAAAKVIALANYADLPVVLKNVERQPLGKS